MKMDKEAAVKHHFWGLIMLYVPLTLLAVIILWTGVAGDLEAKAQEYDKVRENLKAIASKQPIYNQEWIKALEEKNRKLIVQKEKLWKAGWDWQKDIMTWPTELLAQDPKYKEKLDDLYFGDRIEDQQLRARLTVAGEKLPYYTELLSIVKLADPYDPKTGTGVVQFRGAGWRDVLRYVKGWVPKDDTRTDIDSGDTPTSEEVWLAMEDLWVQREIMLIVAATNDQVGVFKKSDAELRAMGETDHAVFTNPTWKLELALVGKKMRWQITNISTRRQVLGIKFKVEFDATHELMLPVSGEPLSPNSSSPWNEIDVVGGPEKLEKVRQVFDYRNAPVKRVDRIELGYHSHRTAPQGLKMDDALKAQMTTPTPASPGTPAKPATPATPPGPAAPVKGGGTGTDKTASGLERNRYVETNLQVRRLPVAFVMVVDEAHLQDLLTAVANSALRIQTTQVQWERFRGDIRPPSDQTVAPKPTGPAPGPMGPSGKHPGGSPMGTTSTDPKSSALVSGTESIGTVEVAVYGIALLYQRYPPRSAAPTGGPGVKPTQGVPVKPATPPNPAPKS